MENSDSEEDIFDDLFDLEIIEFGFPRKVYNRKEHFQEMGELTFFRRFRLHKETVLYLLELVEDELEYPHDLNDSVSPINQLLTTLRFYASAGHLATVGDFCGMHESTVSRIVERVSRCLAGLYKRFVKMPGAEQQIKTQTDFFNMAAFPRVIGVVDGTHIKIQSPGGVDAEIFRNRKHWFSISTQIICDSHLKFLDVVGRWPGSAHDNTIFNSSRIRRKFEEGLFPNCILLGDSGYAQKNYLLTPVADPNTRGQRLYNEAHIRTRNTVERSIGLWKSRFPVKAYGLRVNLDTVLAIIPATAVLHNIAIAMHEPEPPVVHDIDENELNHLIEMGQIPNMPADPENIGYQTDLIANYFSNL